MKHVELFISLVFAATFFVDGPYVVQADSGSADTARRIVASSDCPGGIAVVLGQPGAELAVALSKQGSFTVQVLCSDAESLEKARAFIRSQDAYGRVSADRWSGHGLPYVDNLVNLIVMPDPNSRIPDEELQRALAPLGTAIARKSEARSAQWTPATGISRDFEKLTKPWPEEIDEWTHYLHDANGNPVANDRVVAPPKHYQWISEPIWLRSHETDSSIRTIVTARGRLFYIGDDAPISLAGPNSPPDKWFLTARDAFNGVLLWKVPIQDWGWRAWKGSWFSPRPHDMPLNIEKRLVAIDDKVYVTLGYHAPVSQLDARTGECLQTYKGTEETSEILYHEGVLVLVVRHAEGAQLMAMDAKSGRPRWVTQKRYQGTTTDYIKWKAGGGNIPQLPLDPALDISTDGKVVAFIDGQDIVAVDFSDGKETWRSAFPQAKEDRTAGGMNAQGLWTGTLIIQDGVVVHASPNKLAGFDACSGKLLWTQPKKYLGHLWYEWKDIFVIDGLVWTWSAELDRKTLSGGEAKKVQRSTWPVSVNGYDLHTGKLEKQVDLGNIFKTHHHHRCYRNKATPRFILASRRGTEFVDLQQGHHTVHNWVRGTCHVGMMPANGLQYAPPHPCRCYIEEKLNGMNALAPERQKSEVRDQKSERLRKGPAYGKLASDLRPLTSDSDWPTYRHDPARSGAVKAPVPAQLKMLWRQQVGKKVGAPTIAGDRLFIPLIDEHHVVALDTINGKPCWAYAAGGRIDSPPTYHRGMVIFGSTDGHAYNVRASDGQLAWRFRAGPEDRRMAAFGQIESAWPVHGSVLVQDDLAYFAAGRSSHLDGGLYVFGLDAATGQVRHRTRLEGPSYHVDNIEQNYRLPMGTLPDIMSSDGRYIYMRDVTFDRQLTQQQVPTKPSKPHVKTMSGFLDDSYFKRIPWSFPGVGGYSRLLVHDDQAVFMVRMFDSLQGLSPKVYFTPGEKGYLLFATARQKSKPLWEQRIRVRINAMVITDEYLFTAGPPDEVDPEDPLGAFEGRKGGVLTVTDRESGRNQSQYRLPSPPVFNGMAAAGERLYIALQDGSVACFGD